MAASGRGAPGLGDTARATAGSDPLERLEKLAELHARGVLTDEEFAAQKAKLLDEEA